MENIIHSFIHVCIMTSGIFLICSLLGFSLNPKLTCLAELTDQNLQEFTCLYLPELGLQICAAHGWGTELRSSWL